MKPKPAVPAHAHFQEADIRSLIGVLGPISGLEVDLSKKRYLLLSKLCELIGGDGWAWSLTEQSGDRVICLDAMSGGEIGRLPGGELSLNLKTARGNRTTKSLQRERTRNRDGGASRSVSEKALQKGLTLSTCELSGAKASRITFCRREGRSAFSAREEGMARIVSEEISWLHEINPTCMSLQTELHLSSREQEILTLLAEGFSYKAISGVLRISPHTVHDHIKAIYSCFGINSRAELLKRIDLPGAK